MNARLALGLTGFGVVAAGFGLAACSSRKDTPSSPTPSGPPPPPRFLPGQIGAALPSGPVGVDELAHAYVDRYDRWQQDGLVSKQVGPNTEWAYLTDRSANSVSFDATRLFVRADGINPKQPADGAADFGEIRDAIARFDVDGNQRLGADERAEFDRDYGEKRINATP